MNYEEIKLLEDLNLGKHYIQYEDDPHDIIIPMVGTDLVVAYNYRVFKNSFLRRYDNGRVEVITITDDGRSVMTPLIKNDLMCRRIWGKALSLKFEKIKP